MRQFALVLAAAAALALGGCSSEGQMPPQDAQKLHDVMTRGLGPPGAGKGGAGQAKVAKPSAQPSGN